MRYTVPPTARRTASRRVTMPRRVSRNGRASKGSHPIRGPLWYWRKEGMGLCRERPPWRSGRRNATEGVPNRGRNATEGVPYFCKIGK
jgi:hypothetical protein